MIEKKYHKSGKACRVTFILPKDVNAQQAHICGEFNNWSGESLPMKRLRDGTFKLGMTLGAGRSYRFRYILDGSRWMNEPEADGYVPNPFGNQNSVIRI